MGCGISVEVIPYKYINKDKINDDTKDNTKNNNKDKFITSGSMTEANKPDKKIYPLNIDRKK